MSARERRRGAPAPPAAAPVPRFLVVLVTAVAALCVAFSVSNVITDYDVWEHIAVGRSIWSLHEIPTHYLWTWPSYGHPAVVPSWLFRAVIAPIWDAGGVLGLFAWRWLTTLAAFALLWATARRMGARGLAPLVPLVACALIYRQRSEVRPETLVTVLLALQLWILETRRHGGPDRSVWLVPLAWIWANAHISYHLGFLILGVFTLDAWLASRSRGDAMTAEANNHRPRRLLWVMLAAAAIVFVNPYGWQALASPFRYFLFWRHEALFQAIAELRPPEWREYLRSGAPIVVVAWPLLALWRARRHGIDRVELALLLCFTAFTTLAQRFLGFYAIVAAPYLARDFGDAVASSGLAARVPPLARSLATAAACVAIGLPEWTNPLAPPGVAFEMTQYPVAACDFMARHQVGGRGFNTFHLGPYMIYRFWPERARLPFMDAHQEIASPRDRELYIRAQSERGAWDELDRNYHFDYALLARPQQPSHRLLDFLDADSTWSLVFLEDPAALYVRNDGPLAALGRSRYRWAAGGTARLEELRARCRDDSVACEEITRELERAAAGSNASADAHSLLANIAMMRGNWAEARAQLLAALAVNPRVPLAHQRLGLIAQQEGRAKDAAREFEMERRISGREP